MYEVTFGSFVNKCTHTPIYLYIYINIDTYCISYIYFSLSFSLSLFSIVGPMFISREQIVQYPVGMDYGSERSGILQPNREEVCVFLKQIRGFGN